MIRREVITDNVTVPLGQGHGPDASSEQEAETRLYWDPLPYFSRDQAVPHPYDGWFHLFDATARDRLLSLILHNLTANTEVEISRTHDTFTPEDLHGIRLKEFIIDHTTLAPHTRHGSRNQSQFILVDTLSRAQFQKQFERLIEVACDEQFEVGVESRFSIGLQRLYDHDPVTTLESLKYTLNDELSEEVFAKTLDWLSHQSREESHQEIVELLAAGLDSVSSLVRDIAASSLAYFDEDGALVYLKQAILKEEVRELHADMKELIESLEAT